MRVETAAVMILAICFIISINLAVISFQILDDPLRMQLLALATSFFVAGVVILIVSMTVLITKRLLARRTG